MRAEWGVSKLVQVSTDLPFWLLARVAPHSKKRKRTYPHSANDVPRLDDAVVAELGLPTRFGDESLQKQEVKDVDL